MIKKQILHYKDQILIAPVAMACVLGVYSASVFEDRREIVVNGILGLVVLYLMYLTFLSPKRIIDAPSKIKFESLRDIKYVAFAFFWTMIMFWAFSYILNLVVYFLSGTVGK